MQLTEEQIEVMENCERIKTRLKHLSDYYVNDEVNDILDYTIDYLCLCLGRTRRKNVMVRESREACAVNLLGRCFLPF